MCLQRFFFLVLLLRQQAFLLGDFSSERPTITTIAIKTQVFMLHSERVNSTRKCTIVVEIVTLLNLCCFVSALSSRNENKYTRNLNLPPFLSLVCFYGNGANHSHVHSIAHAWRKHAQSFDRCTHFPPVS